MLYINNSFYLFYLFENSFLWMNFDTSRLQRLGVIVFHVIHQKNSPPSVYYGYIFDYLVNVSFLCMCFASALLGECVYNLYGVRVCMCVLCVHMCMC